MDKSIYAQVWLNKVQVCAGIDCKVRIRHPAEGIFVCRGPRAVAFCSHGCLIRTTSQASEKLYADDAAQKDLLGGLGYSRGKK